ncbi:MAG: hypothetical protein PVH29_09985 [Candidatus Zixiibacteriota bacterium]
MVDLYGTDAVIFSGLAVSDGSKPDTFRITAGRARDNEKYHVVLPADLDNLSLDTTGDIYYIAIKHRYEESESGAPVKDTSAGTYDRIRADAYEVGIDTDNLWEIDGWVLLAKAMKGVQGWEYHYLETDGSGTRTRSRQAVRDVAFWTFTIDEVEAEKPVFMNHHGVSSDVFPGPFDVVINRIAITANSSGDQDVTATATVGDGTLQVVLPDGDTGTVVAYDPIGQIVSADQKVQVTISKADTGDGPYDVAVVVSGYRTGEIR